MPILQDGSNTCPSGCPLIHLGWVDKLYWEDYVCYCHIHFLFGHKQSWNWSRILATQAKQLFSLAFLQFTWLNKIWGVKNTRALFVCAYCPSISPVCMSCQEGKDKLLGKVGQQFSTGFPGRQGVQKKCPLYPTSYMGILPLQCTLILHIFTPLYLHSS